MCTASFKYRRYLIFSVGQEEYGMPINRIREIIGYIPAIPFTGFHGVFQGMINLRKEIIPIIDLRITIRTEQAMVTPRTCIIIVYITVENEEVLVGVVVDGVCEILDAPESMMGKETFRFDFSQNPHVSWGSAAGRPRSVFFRK